MTNAEKQQEALRRARAGAAQAAVDEQNTPWGEPQTMVTIAAGIVHITTASHGGCRLSPARAAQVLDKFPTYQPWIEGGEWWEEDADMALVIATFPTEFRSYLLLETISRATESARRIYNRQLERR